MLVLSNLGIAITPLLTSLGVAGIAIAFALQNILEDIFSSISIYVDKPFRIGDFVEVDGVSGTVEHIGIKTTRLRTIQGEEVVLANKHVINKNLHNYGKIQERNVRTTIGVTYETARATLEMIP